jgi:hypothetical protein
MPTIRSAPPPMIPPRPASDARAAFFRAVAPPMAVQAPQAQAAPAPAPAARPEPAGESVKPQPYLRPGSIIDIKV